MASLRRKPSSQYWFACFTLPNGLRTQRSTKTTSRKLAQKIAHDYESAARSRMTETQVRRVLSDLHRMNSNSALGSASIREVLNQWISSKKGTVSAATELAYGATVDEFCDFLGDRAELELLYLGKADIAAFRDHVASSRAPSTANKRLKILRVALGQAWRDGIIDDNPAAKVPLLKLHLDQGERRPFTLRELQMLMKAADNEWKGMILFGVYTGQRLGDIVRLRWSNIDLQEGIVTLTTRKTHRRQILPLATPLREWLQPRLSFGTVADEPLFPTLLSRVERSGQVGALSNLFYELMASLGMVPARSHVKKGDGEGRAGRRAPSGLSFHSLRHTATSLMKNAGVSPAVVQEFVGHDSKAISEHYTHIELASLRKAAEAMPSLE